MDSILEKINSLEEEINKTTDTDLKYEITNEYTLEGTTRCTYEEVAEAVELAINRKNLEFNVKIFSLLYDIKNLKADTDTIEQVLKLIQKHLQ